MLKSKYTKFLAIISGLALAATASAQVVLGSFQSSSDPNNAGWVDSQNGNPISSDPNYSFVNAGVAGYSSSLLAGGPASGFGNPTIKLSLSPAQIAAFNTNSWVTFTFSAPASTNYGGTGAGYSQIYNFVLNAPGYGYNNQKWTNALEMGNTNSTTPGTQPNFYFSATSPLQTMVVSVNYSSVTNAIIAGGEGYLQMSWQCNVGGGAPTNIILNNVFLSQNAFGGGIVASNVYIVDDFSTNGVGPTNSVGDDYLAAGAFSYATNGITNVYSEWFGNGITSLSFNPNVNVSGNTNSNGAMQINFTWNAATDGYQQWLLWHGNANTYLPTVAGGTTGIGYPTYTNVSCDVRFDPSSVTNAVGVYGVIRLMARGVGDFNQPWLNDSYMTITDANWHHISGQLLGTSVDAQSVGDIVIGEDVNAYAGGRLTGNQILYVDNIKATGPLVSAPLPPPTLSGPLPATPGLRIIAGSTANNYDRAEITTVPQTESWIGASGHVNYSFTLLSYPKANINQTMIEIAPFNPSSGPQPLGGSYPGGGNESFDFETTNLIWLALAPLGNGEVTATVMWKTNDPGANPTNRALVFTNSTAIGTWTWTFTGPNTGTVTGPGTVVNGPAAGPAEPFTIADPNVSTDFQNPAVAIFGLQPNSTAGEGLWEDWASTSISGLPSGNINDDWTHQTSDFSANSGISPDGNWSAQGSANPPEIIIANSNDAYWFNWTVPVPAAGFGIVAGTNLLTSPSTWVDLPFYANNTDYFPPRANSAVLLGNKYWTLIPYDDLPTVNGSQQPSPPAITVPLAPKAFFIGTTNFQNQYP
jgi:hypothetical protein